MKIQSLPRFTAEASLGSTFAASSNRSANERFVGDDGRIHPAAFYHLAINPEILKHFFCYYRCYSNCIKNWPGYEANCQGVAQTCCTYGYHCSWCEP
jgi:hypothetical protein